MLSRTATYAVRALAHMAAAGPERWLLNREIAADLSLPAPFLTKILRTLAEHGLLESQRGKTGGFRLARPSYEISLLDVVDPIDRLSDPPHCLLGQNVCSDDHPCPLHEEWTATSAKIKNLLRRTTLADIADQEDAGGFPRPVVISAGRKRSKRGARVVHRAARNGGGR